jgi:hypothetical protein
LLDPCNQEIPTIIGRLFENQNLNDVMQSVYMKKAYEFLEKIGVQGSLRYRNEKETTIFMINFIFSVLKIDIQTFC